MFAYLDDHSESLQGVPSEKILHYHQTNFSDDPWLKFIVFQRGVKYPERNMNCSKGCISALLMVNCYNAL